MSNVLYSSADNKRVHRTGVANGLQSTGKDSICHSIKHYDGWNCCGISVDVGVHNHPRNYDLHGANAIPAVFYDFWTANTAFPQTAKAEAQANSSTNHADQEIRSGN